MDPERSCEAPGQLITLCAAVHHEAFKNVAEGIQSIITSVALVIGGIWACWKFVLTRGATPKVDLDVDVSFVHKQGAKWIIEGVAMVKNPGRDLYLEPEERSRFSFIMALPPEATMDADGLRQQFGRDGWLGHGGQGLTPAPKAARRI